MHQYGGKENNWSLGAEYINVSLYTNTLASFRLRSNMRLAASLYLYVLMHRNKHVESISSLIKHSQSGFFEYSKTALFTYMLAVFFTAFGVLLCCWCDTATNCRLVE